MHVKITIGGSGIFSYNFSNSLLPMNSSIAMVFPLHFQISPLLCFWHHRLSKMRVLLLQDAGLYITPDGGGAGVSTSTCASGPPFFFFLLFMWITAFFSLFSSLFWPWNSLWEEEFHQSEWVPDLGSVESPWLGITNVVCTHVCVILWMLGMVHLLSCPMGVFGFFAIFVQVHLCIFLVGTFYPQVVCRYPFLFSWGIMYQCGPLSGNLGVMDNLNYLAID